MRRKNTTSEMMNGYMADSLLILMRDLLRKVKPQSRGQPLHLLSQFGSKDEIVKHYFYQIIYSYIASLPSAPSSMQEYLLGMFSHYYGYKDELLLMYKAKVTHIMLETLNGTFSAIRADVTRESRYATHYHTGGYI